MSAPSSLFKPVANEQVAAKVGMFGGQGSGKTTTSFLMLLGLSLTFHKGAPIFFLDTENGSDYLEPIAKIEGVPLMVAKSRAFRDMCAGLTEATAAGACGYLVDSYTHPWNELIDIFKKRSSRNKLEFHHMQGLKSMWQLDWTERMLNSNLHCVLAGRLGYEWDREEDDADGEKGDLIKVNSKMKSESEAGYEPSLLIEMEGLQDAGRVKRTRAKRGTITHFAHVLKDRRRTLNGKSFSWPDMNDYKKGDWKKVYKAFAPHFAHLAIGRTQQAVNSTRSSAALFDGRGTSDFGRRRDIALEEVKEASAAMFGGQTAGDKRARQIILEEVLDTMSWTKVETLPVVQLEAAARVLLRVKAQVVVDRDLVGTEEALQNLLRDALAADEAAAGPAPRLNAPDDADIPEPVL